MMGAEGARPDLGKSERSAARAPAPTTHRHLWPLRRMGGSSSKPGAAEATPPPASAAAQKAAAADAKKKDGLSFGWEEKNYGGAYKSTRPLQRQLSSEPDEMAIWRLEARSLRARAPPAPRARTVHPPALAPPAPVPPSKPPLRAALTRRGGSAAGLMELFDEADEDIGKRPEPIKSRIPPDLDLNSMVEKACHRRCTELWKAYDRCAEKKKSHEKCSGWFLTYKNCVDACTPELTLNVLETMASGDPDPNMERLRR